MSLEMYLEGYHNVIESIKELKNTPNNETRIAELEKVIEENQKKIYDWQVSKGDEKQFEEYMAPFNKEITDAEKEIKELTATKEANAELRAKNTTEAEEKKKYLENIRENAKKQYEENKKSFEDEWQKGSLREEYEDLSQELEQAKKDKEIFEKPNRTKEEQIGYERISKKILATSNRMAQIKREFNTKKQNIENEYNEFLKEADRLDEEAGIVTKQSESQELESEQLPENENPTQTPVEPMTQAQQIPQQETQQTEPQTVGATQTPENENPTQTPVEPMTQAQQIPQQETQQTEPQTVGATQTPENQNPTQSPVEPVAQEEQIPEEKQQVDDKLNVEVFAEEVRVNGEKVSVEDINKLCNGKHWHIIKEMLIGELGEEKVDQVIDHGDPNIIAAILISGEMNEKVAADSVNKYHEAIFNPKAKENKMAIKYNLKNMSFISRLLGKCHLDEEEVKAIKDRAYEARNYAEIEAGPLTKLGFKIRDMIDRASQKRLADKQNKEQVDEKTPKQELPGELTPEQKAQVQQRTAEIAGQHTQQLAQQQENDELGR